ncbi:MAG: sigma-54 interaction domain-containing protein [bacterium]
MIKHPYLTDLQIEDHPPEHATRHLRSVTFDDIVGESPKMKEVIQLGKRISEASFLTVLIQGETGTGKELFARAIHNSTFSGGEPFVEINSSAIPETLLEAELFGYEKGAFTDATKPKKGLLELANSGTLFLDEIGSMSLNLQAKLLNVLEEKRFRRLGGTKDIEVSVKIIAATNTDLLAAIRDGYFREDLYYRLAVVSVCLPPLRERGNDVILLANHFVNLFCTQHRKKQKRLAERTKELLLACPWPGNVRELRNAIQRAVLLSRGDVIMPWDISVGIRTQTTLESHNTSTENNITIALDPLGTPLEEIEKQIILKVLELTNWNKSKAAYMLRISRPRLLRKLKALGIRDDSNNESKISKKIG